MKALKIFAFALLLAVGVLVAAAFTGSKKTSPSTNGSGENTGFAVVELFTSEGCSSCPAADAVVAKIEKEYKGKSVYILAYHVDYWNRLGWKDVFSSADYSHRQSTYASWLKLSSVYTPQVIVNGRKEFVGSQEGTLRNAIRAGLDQPAIKALKLVDIKTGNSQPTISYTSESATGNSLVLALVKKNATTIVKRGENSGRTLSHVQIVTQLKSSAITANKGNVQLALPSGFKASEYEVIAFVQNPANGNIIAAARFALPTTYSAAN
ncbi:DUF1223 domain-containing protein [Mucilaginibacter sp.]|uniref:DUF1223 domain-containing protein n=1 Tax=Mucilaginibacter sp. TaxID=1882438 RepID=UPI0035BBC41D